jgi:hypothetical protein
MAGAVNHQIRRFHQRSQLPLGQKAMEAHFGGKTPVFGHAHHFAVQCVLTDHIHLELMPGLFERDQRPKQRGLVLDSIEACHMNESQSDSAERSRATGIALRPGIEVHAKGYSLRLETQCQTGSQAPARWPP